MRSDPIYSMKHEETVARCAIVSHLLGFSVPMVGMDIAHDAVHILCEVCRVEREQHSRRAKTDGRCILEPTVGRRVIIS